MYYKDEIKRQKNIDDMEYYDYDDLVEEEYEADDEEYEDAEEELAGEFLDFMS